MIRVTLCDANGEYHDVFKPTHEVVELIENKQNLVWVDFCAPDEKEMQFIGKSFQQHPLLVDAIMHPNERPKLFKFGEQLFLMIFYVLAIDEEHHVRETKLTLVMGDNWLLTVHPDRIPEIEEAEKRWGLNTFEIERGIWVLVYSLLDTLVDSYSDLLDSMFEHVDTVEEKLINPSRKKVRDKNDKMVRPNYVVYSFNIKKKLLNIRHVILPAKDIINSFSQYDSQLHNKTSDIYFDYIEDHITHIITEINVHMEELNSAVNTNLSIISNDLNQVMRTLTSTSIILASATLIAGIYGMNFKILPELEWDFGYGYSLILMLIVGFAIYLFLKWRDWF